MSLGGGGSQGSPPPCMKHWDPLPSSRLGYFDIVYG